jgi:hypothetical protein
LSAAQRADRSAHIGLAIGRQSIDGITLSGRKISENARRPAVISTGG